ncbi:hypothetical protein SAMN05428978_11017 [Nitrosomonas sp. Nm34]|nr:hypothetical protein SAMN05428978_11017 [Nitrosomonas sp. Nm34]
MEERPEWVRCIGYGVKVRIDGKKTWCGKINIGFGVLLFIDINHAALQGERGGKLVAFRECVAVIIKSLQNGHDNPEYVS